MWILCFDFHGESLSIFHSGASAGDPSTRKYRTRSCSRDGFPAQNSISLRSQKEYEHGPRSKIGHDLLWNHSPSAPEFWQWYIRLRRTVYDAKLVLDFFYPLPYFFLAYNTTLPTRPRANPASDGSTLEIRLAFLLRNLLHPANDPHLPRHFSPEEGERCARILLKLTGLA
jgi:hypothetical protein